MRLLDRYIIKSFLINYLLAFCVLLGMYILMDLIINFDRFTKVTTGMHISGTGLFLVIMRDIFDYYSYQLLVIFQQVCVAIPLLAAGFSMVRMTRSNELSAMLASGVSLYRVAAPIIICASFFSLLVIVDQEFLMPNYVDKLLRKQEEVGLTTISNKENRLDFLRDSDNSLIIASNYDSTAKTLSELKILKRDGKGMITGRNLADTAIWDPEYQSEPGVPRGAWIMKNSLQIDDTNNDPNTSATEKVKDSAYTTGLTPRQLDIVFRRKQAEYLSSAQIHDLIINSPALTQPQLEKIMHQRFTQPLMNVILLLIGIPFLLTRIPGRLMINMAYCAVVTGVCFVSTFVIFSMAGSVMPVLLGTWLPVLIFAPFSLVMLDNIKT